MFRNFVLLVLTRVVVARDLNCIMLNVAFLLDLVDVSVYVYALGKREDLNDVCKKMKKVKAKNKNGAQKDAEINFCAHQYLYNSE